MKKGINKFLKISVGAGGKIFMNPEDLIKGVTSQENIIIIDSEKDVPEEKYELSYADFKSIISVWSNFNNSHISALLIKIQNLDHFICSLHYITSC